MYIIGTYIRQWTTLTIHIFSILNLFYLLNKVNGFTPLLNYSENNLNKSQITKQAKFFLKAFTNAFIAINMFLLNMCCEWILILFISKYGTIKFNKIQSI